MSNRWRQTVPSAMVAMTWVVLAPPAAAQARQALTVTIVVHDFAGLPPSVMEEAKQVAVRIYDRIGVGMTWVDAGSVQFEQAMSADPETREAWLESAITLHLLPSAMAAPLHAPSEALGKASPGGHVAWVLCDRVKTLPRASRNLELLLGAVIAHEIGHLLLSTNAHSASGLMTAQMNLQLAGQQLLWFSPKQGDSIRANVSSAAIREW